jgi:hypothetical protein
MNSRRRVNSNVGWLTLSEDHMVTLRVSGANFDVDAFLRESNITPAVVFRRGQPKFPASHANGRRLDHSAMNIGVSDAEFGNIEQQTQETLQFLVANLVELERLRTYPGVDGLELDFAVNGNDDAFVESYRFAPELLDQIARLGITLCVSRYIPASDATQHIVGREAR